MKLKDVLNEEDRRIGARPESTTGMSQTERLQHNLRLEKEAEDAKSPEQKKAEADKKQAYKDDQERKFKERQAASKAGMCKGKHNWAETSTSSKGLTKYKCKDCPATKQVDSGD